jgi:hypothetical protein
VYALRVGLNGPSILEGCPLTASEISQQMRYAAHLSWAKTADRTERTAKARNAFEDKFLAQAEGDPKRAEAYRKAYFTRLAMKSAQARRRRGGAKV